MNATQKPAGGETPRAYDPAFVPLTGREYLDSLNDDREVWIYGERVKNVAEHPAFRNSARMIARMYDALHDPKRQAALTIPTEWGGFTQRFFRAPLDVQEQVAQRDAIAEWQRVAWGWMGRSPDYKGSFLGTLGANAAFYKGFEDNAARWYRKAQERTWYVNHAIMHPPVDRDLPTADGNDVYVKVVKENDAGIWVTGAKVVATNSALTNYTFIAHIAQVPIADPKFAPVFIVPTGAPGVKLLCRVSNEYRAATTGSPFDYPLSSRLDENDAILVLDNVFVPWEDVFMHGDLEQANKFNTGSGFLERASLHGCTRFAVKMDFITGLLARALEITGAKGFHGVQSQLGEVIAWRNAFWALSDAMAKSAVNWNGMVRPDPHFAGAYRVLNQMAMPKIKNIIEQVVASGLIYLNSHAVDFQTPDIRGYLDKYVRGSGGITATERVKVMKMLWDAIGTEFGSRHELYEINYIGSNDITRLTNLWAAEGSGNMARFKAFAQTAMDEYDLNGWTVPDLVNPDDVSLIARKG
ncbi:4-hydroxyphenylacetate 3-hydroxylase N-terminal domain-containing protein [Ruixingdingia sedimenti]|uniref:4-hydroxyphenylacetate 3-hydroxylase N-terminal domain-containing protein n=1 Tax=Ruixingdingia sedimenti TaxID=3073604 RepID=A0ABU1F6D6_9RHOB|nr:4-hydroxyphenylacetate 3-hydroxylase N-terminal domain-containing protein [Xinfangfangia sp. LG-4]MDR5652430.1 4-hydroxyphenylacetate 3-hydroxylase N-terminal domain-containing protein [Xinfangfangia sp. LG-4]